MNLARIGFVYALKSERGVALVGLNEPKQKEAVIRQHWKIFAPADDVFLSIRKARWFD